jgi:hypothetical protein
MIRVGDDVGAQQAMMLSPKAWRQLAKPRFKYMFDQFRKRTRTSSSDYIPAAAIRRSPDEVELGAHRPG